MQNCDVAYILGRGSVWGDNMELRYSLRSVNKYAESVGEVFVVGEKPKFMEGFTHIEARDSTTSVSRNAHNKIIAACDDASVSDPFLLMYDDLFFSKHTNISEYPFYKNMDFSDFVNGLPLKNAYNKSIINTYRHLSKIGKPTINYELHLPILIHKEKYLKSTEGIDWKTGSHLYRSVYANFYNLGGHQICDMKINEELTRQAVIDTVGGRHCFSVGNSGICDGFKDAMLCMYPVRSKWEKSLCLS